MTLFGGLAIGARRRRSLDSVRVGLRSTARRRRSCSRSSRCSGSSRHRVVDDLADDARSLSVGIAQAREPDRRWLGALGTSSAARSSARRHRRPARRSSSSCCRASLGADWITTFTSVAIYSVVAAGFGVLYGRVGMISLGQVALLVDRLLGRRRGSPTRRRLPFPLLPARRRRDHVRGRRARRAAGAAALGPLPGADHADVRGRDRRSCSPRSTSRTAAAGSRAARRPATSSGTPPVRRPALADGGHGVLPLRRSSSARSCSCSRWCTSRASRGARGRRSARASRRRSRQASTSRSTRCGRSRSRRS